MVPKDSGPSRHLGLVQVGPVDGQVRSARIRLRMETVFLSSPLNVTLSPGSAHLASVLPLYCHPPFNPYHVIIVIYIQVHRATAIQTYLRFFSFNLRLGF